jgi:hypothetical protein
MKQIKIGILGEIRAGKDTVSQLISHEIREMGSKKPTEYFAFSTGIHDVIKLTMPEINKQGKPRQALQHIGQSLREIKPDVWIDYLFNSRDFTLADILGQNMIVTDVRQPNEALRLQEAGFKIIKVTASEEVRLQRANQAGDNFNPAMFKHETELAIQLCPYDFLIDNSYSIDVLEDAVRSILGEVVGDE